MKHVFNGLISRFDMTELRISDLKDRFKLSSRDRNFPEQKIQ